MSSNEFCWESLTHTDSPPNGILKAALFTTYDRPDERLLVEHLLPALLKLNHELSDSDPTERQYFLLELDQRLKQLHNKLVVVSSTVQEEPHDTEEITSGVYGWIWRSIRHCTVGRYGKAIQHAKLWLLHWNDDGAEYLEIIVSSANLTRSAFTGQIQGAWRACIQLDRKPSQERLKSWGLLPGFLDELSLSASGDKERLKIFRDLLFRADCPEGIEFLASVPGRYSRQELRGVPWGAAGLRNIVPSGRGIVYASILSPYVGAWSNDALKKWCANYEGQPSRLALVWIEKNHPWARCWLLPLASLDALDKEEATLLHLRALSVPNAPDKFHKEHRHTDERWSHAKVYAFRRGNSKKLLITSANFSLAAWGKENSDGTLEIGNFELGVCVSQAAWPLDGLQPFEDKNDAATVPDEDMAIRNNPKITWGQASWNGKQIAVTCRCVCKLELIGKIVCDNRKLRIPAWSNEKDDLRSAKYRWENSKELPSFVELTCGKESVRVPIFDERSEKYRADSLPPEVDEDQAQAMRDNLLFEQYGGRVPGETGGAEAIENATDTEQSGEVSTNYDSYDVHAFVLARLHLGIVDCWADKVGRVLDDDDRQRLRRDGELLKQAFSNQSEREATVSEANAIGARLAAEEIALRLKHLPEA